MQLLASITFGQGLLTVLEIGLLATWVWLAVSVILDVYRTPDLTPAATAGWIFVILLIPLLGVMIYVIARGDKMSQHEIGGERQLEDLRGPRGAYWRGIPARQGQGSRLGAARAQLIAGGHHRPTAFRRTSDRERTHDERHTQPASFERLR